MIEISPGPHHGRLADRHRVIALRQIFLDPAIQRLVLEEQHRIVVANGGFDQSFGIVSGGGATTFNPGVCTNHVSGFCEWNGPP